MHFPMQSQGIAKVLQNSFDFTEKIVAKALQSLGFAKVLQSQGIAKVFEDIWFHGKFALTNSSL